MGWQERRLAEAVFTKKGPNSIELFYDLLLGVGLSKNPDIEALDPISELARRSARCGPLSSSAEIRLTFLAAKTEEVFEKLNSTARFEWWALLQSVRRMLTLYTLLWGSHYATRVAYTQVGHA